jgi:hypothetical protein
VNIASEQTACYRYRLLHDWFEPYIAVVEHSTLDIPAIIVIL